MLSLIRISVLSAPLILTGHVHARSASDPVVRDTTSTLLPTVDLDYVVQRATVFNDTGKYYSFNNVRYAQPPTGELRFRAPLPPKTNRTIVETGEVDRICPQANPAWFGSAQPFATQYLAGKRNFTLADFATNSSNSSLPTEDPRTTEDCLFLDVQIPKDIFDQASNSSFPGAPVLVWLYGGGYIVGSKQEYGNPAGLLARSQNNNNNGIIYVALNYRLGAFGWLAGPTLQEDGTANVGLHDQQLALEWVQTHIHKFGGDPSRVTVFGQSAGGASIMHHITAFGGAKPPPFQQAVIQSPGWYPIVSTIVQESTYNDFLALAGASSIAEARKLPYETLQAANIKQVGVSSYGQFTYGPAVDGVFVPQLPGQLLAKGQFTKDIKILVGYNSREGLLFTSPYISNGTDYEMYIDSLLPTVSSFPSYKNYIVNTLYPSTAFPDQLARASQTIADVAFVCNTFYLNKAFQKHTYAYLFDVPPAIHSTDTPYTFYNDGAASNTVKNPGIAIALQEYITHFAEFGFPSEVGTPFFPMYGENATVQVLNATSIVQVEEDERAVERCDWWQKALYY